MRLSRLPAALFIVAYLAATGWFLLRQLAGRPGRSEWAYGWTWDMFPSYETESVRRRILVQDRAGRAWQLVPGERDRFRWGNDGDAARIDLDRRNESTLRLAEAAFARWSAVHDAAGSRVLVVERYLPLSQNVDRAQTLDTIGEGESRWSWRIVARASATDRTDAERGPLAWEPLP
ncbi:MAG: hypothetical protein IT428_23455 [Planctomycetaceae bacterium]|nr:hypothetical protein [Planctomycetaceae bacterium]